MEKAKIRTIGSPLVTFRGKPFEHQEASPRSSGGSTLQANLLHSLDALALQNEGLAFGDPEREQRLYIHVHDLEQQI